MSARNLITFICTANICRSPMAERLMAHALSAEPEPLRSLKTASAGISAYGGDSPSPNSVRVLAIFCMTSMHRLLLESQFNPSTKHIYLMREFLPPNVEHEIPDPYGLDRSEYETARDSMVEAIPSILAFLRKEYKPKGK
jgi:protein-tyrosine-phosphatase